MAAFARSSTIFTLAGVTILSGLLAYAVYFDYRRRNDASFRKKLRKEKKRADKDAAQAAPAAIDPAALRDALSKIKDEELPPGPEEKEQYFMSQVGLGEQLSLQGPMSQLPAALAFYRALRVYPSPVELIMIYQKTVPAPVFNLIVELTNMDVKIRVEGYFDYFPKRSMNVTVQENPETRKKYLVAEKDFEAGDVIYKEEPIVAVLDRDLQEAGTYCTHCLRLIHKAIAIKPDSDRINAIYCSKECQVKSKTESQNFLFGSEPILPPEMDGGMSQITRGKRNQAQSAFTDYIKSTAGNAPLLLARFVARQIGIETSKLLPRATVSVPQPDLTEPEGDYGITDHLERLRYVETQVSDEEHALFKELLEATLPGLEQSLPKDKHPINLGKIAYNAYGISYSGGRDDRPTLQTRPEDREYTRTPNGTSRQIGSGIYMVSAYISHSCDPNARPAFSSGTSELNLVASRPIKKGEELTVAYVDVTQHEGESPEEARRRRRYELARGWRFKCECARCLSEAEAPAAAAEEQLGVQKDESKVESVVERVERGEAGVVSDTD